jgi:RNA polymerase subunit RPABC4/transcription elongation factor Spt4
MCPDESVEGGCRGPRLVPDGGRPASGNEECGSCGKLIDTGTTYCPHCGTHERDRGSDGEGGSSGGDGGGSSRRTAAVERREDDDGGSGGSSDADGSRTARSTSDFAGGKSGRKGYDERRGERDSGRENDRSNRERDRSGRSGDSGDRKRDKRSRNDARSGRTDDRSGRSGDAGGRTDENGSGERSGRDGSPSDGRTGRGGGRSGNGSTSSGRSGRAGGGVDRGGRERSESQSGGGGGRRTPDDGEEFCAACGEIIDANASVCPSCGDEREVASPPSGASTGASGAPSPSNSSGRSTPDSDSSGSGRGGATGASESSPSTSTSLNNPTVNGWRWKIGWQPKKIIVGLTIFGAIVGAMLEYIGQFAFFGLVVGVLVWFWGRGEVNAKYLSLIQDFRDETRSKVERETGGMALSSAHTFIGGHSGSPLFIEPSKKYKASHLLFGDTSVVINRQYHYEMPGRDTTQGGKQQEVFYDQIANVQSEDFANYAELQISLSSGQTERIKGRDTSGINGVKRDLQQKMRDARR